MSVLYIRNAVTGKFEPVRTIKGNTGEDGGYYTPAVDSDGNLTWTASKAGMPDIPGANIKGPAGSGGSGSAYELPIASAAQLGGVMPVAKTDEMTQPVGVDESGGLWALPGGGSDEKWELINEVVLEEDSYSVIVNQDANGNRFALNKVLAVCNVSCNSTSKQALCVGVTNNDNHAIYVANGVKNTGYYCWTSVHLENVAGYLYAAGFSSDKCSSSPGVIGGIGEPIAPSIAPAVKTFTPITFVKFRVSNWGTNYFLKESTFKVYGVRA